MKITKQAVAGTLESSDLLVKVGPSDTGKLDIVIRSEVIKQFGKQIRRTVDETLSKLHVTKARWLSKIKAPWTMPSGRGFRPPSCAGLGLMSRIGGNYHESSPKHALCTRRQSGHAEHGVCLPA